MNKLLIIIVTFVIGASPAIADQFNTVNSNAKSKKIEDQRAKEKEQEAEKRKKEEKQKTAAREKEEKLKKPIEHKYYCCYCKEKKKAFTLYGSGSDAVNIAHCQSFCKDFGGMLTRVAGECPSKPPGWK